MIKRILVPLDPSPYSLAAIEWACLMAKILHRSDGTTVRVAMPPEEMMNSRGDQA